MAVYVYSIVLATHPQRLDSLHGVGDPPATLRTVRTEMLSAVVSDAPEELRPKRRDLSAHQAVQEQLMADGTVLPLQFGFTTVDDDAVRAVLEDGTDNFSERLRALEGCVEYHLKATQDEDALLRQILQESDEARELNEEIRSSRSSPELPLALGELVSQEVQARQDRLAVAVLDALRGLAREERSSQPTGNDFLNVSFLVERDNEKTFLGAEQDIAKKLGEDFDLRLVGPLPAYSFV
ncbi:MULTISPECIES: GvpL/GvpF family gas vesicle protein [unclassified Streptomyces]|uniref:GvpL/GvpF family gas vesicle protein n=1 Tax=unclassified Streptomyces TaxID=2593676 RepID=UPI0022530022|nr:MULTISPECIES: GvpL/GvpF family gas vesicle protein [unclassified Streptomyces]WSU20846.1 GvpL/GvpF family gas vesicle protein [Streptomyces sp. NBC_01108]MCX4790351.1 GvpL/GvpF family gas vesicle protein [Streptomyces sp. NBC_01221]MCX4793923.1 GvpL/GvpF family gas vesicle protein [Streptomyces sp. NBC_01242]WSJ35339.1 GvpL/GvpF family gas vesicle protein [Streptomyces sp. NBC_01321]WSP61773.1 GvpL/GvpF family gas vesicle protein [Streptomyces sp. NBC_01240]